jgi:hypothetical protein
MLHLIQPARCAVFCVRLLRKNVLLSTSYGLIEWSVTLPSFKLANDIKIIYNQK